MISSACSSINWWSAVRYGSHSTALIMTHSALNAGGGHNFTCVGKQAPPKPTIPASAIFFTISSAVRLHSFTNVSVRSMVSSHSSPSTSMNTAGLAYPLASTIVSIFATFPLTDEWIAADTKPPGSAIFVPTFTTSPLATIGFAGAPICWLNKITAFAGISACTIG